MATNAVSQPMAAQMKSGAAPGIAAAMPTTAIVTATTMVIEIGSGTAIVVRSRGMAGTMQMSWIGSGTAITMSSGMAGAMKMTRIGGAVSTAMIGISSSSTASTTTGMDGGMAVDMTVKMGTS